MGTNVGIDVDGLKVGEIVGGGTGAEGALVFIGALVVDGAGVPARTLIAVNAIKHIACKKENRMILPLLAVSSRRS